MRFMRFLIVIFLLFFSISFLYGIQISEIDFGSNEYVELIVSNQTIFNQSFQYITDQSDGKNNSYSILKYVNNSNITLIVGSSFLDNYDIDNLSCSIYQTSGTQVGYRGMSSKSESFEIFYDGNKSVEFVSYGDLNFGLNESLHFDFELEEFVISNRSICEISVFDNLIEDIVENESLNISFENQSYINQSLNVSDFNSSIGNCQLFIDTQNLVDGSKLSFTFLGNYSLGVEYYIENGRGDIVKNKLISSTSTSKSYTPKENGKYTIYGSINSNNCSVKNSSIVYFYNSNLDIQEEKLVCEKCKKTSSSSSSLTSTINVEKDTFLEIDKILMKTHNEIELHIKASRGESSKYILYVYLNNKEITKFNFKKYSSIDFMIPLTVNSGEYEIEVKAFGLEDSEKIEIVNFDEHNFVSEKDLDIRLEDFFEKINKSMNSEFSCQSVGLSQGVYNSFEQEEKKIEMVEMKSYSKHFLSQNIGLLIICFGIVLVSLVIILHR